MLLSEAEQTKAIIRLHLELNTKLNQIRKCRKTSELKLLIVEANNLLSLRLGIDRMFLPTPIYQKWLRSAENSSNAK